ncbi:uncharacterized protein LOC143578243 [Bidens hawaiensis]|uniref:uncharacterized protein LOC143578243 n=1 Tax=Bidens hawaiensis TaxID=980011 RepID=UPI00404AF055
MKLPERVIEARIRRETQVKVNQFGFMLGRSITEAIHILRRLMEKYRDKKRDPHMVFIDLEKAYDSVPRQLLWDSLEGRGVPEKYVDIVRDMHVRTDTTVLVLDELSKSIQEKIPWCMIFADDIVLVTESKQDLNKRLDEWQVAIERKVLRISRTRTEYLHCDFSGVNGNEDIQIIIEGQVVPQTTNSSIWGRSSRVMEA